MVLLLLFRRSTVPADAGVVEEASLEASNIVELRPQHRRPAPPAALAGAAWQLTSV